MRTYVLEPTAGTPLYEQLYQAIQADIRTGVLRGGEKLPSKRALAEHLNVSRITVENAYGQLLAEGYIASRPRSGFYVEQLELLPAPAAAAAAAPIREAPAPALPSASAGQFPFSVWARLMRGVLLDRHDQLLATPPNTGLPELRRAIAGMLCRSRGMEVPPENIVIGAGAEYLYNILIQLLGRGHRYGVEDPGHRKFYQVCRANDVALATVALDDSGVDPGALNACGATVLHSSPGHQFPTGIVMPISRRSQLMSWLGSGADRWLIEDDYDSEFRFSGKPIPSMYSMDTIGRVIYLNTFSKTITPALRISYMILPEQLMARYRSRLGFYSCTVPSFEQLTLARFLDEGHFEKHVSRMKRRYRLLREELFALLRQSPLADRMRWKGDAAGLHFLLQLQTRLSDEALERSLADAGIRAACLSRYAIDLPAEETAAQVVLHYSELETADLPGIVAALEKTLRL